MSILISLIAFIITIGILVAVHEYGHFWVARKLGVKVLRYSIGFGKPIWRKVSSNDPDQTEYVVSAIPFGGYVKMLDEREGEVAEEELHRAFNRQVLWKRFLIVLAGPAFNFLFAIFAYSAMFMVGVDGLNPYVGSVTAESPAAKAGFQPMDKIVAVNGKNTKSLDDSTLLLLGAYLDTPANINVDVITKNGSPAVRTLDLSSLQMLRDEGGYLEKTGLQPWLPWMPGVGDVLPGKPAAIAGLKAGDKILAADGNDLKTVNAFIDYVGARPGKPVDLLVKRDEKTMNIVVTPEAQTRDGKTVGVMGIKVGQYISPENRDMLRTIVRYSPLEAAVHGWDKTWQMTAMTFKVIGRLITGEASIKNVSGPITIANYAGKSLVIGFSVFLGFLAIVSISLGVMNLLPVPMLDGGHLLYYAIEFFKGSPVSEAAQEVGMRIGVAMVASLMLLAFYNDILRLIK